MTLKDYRHAAGLTQKQLAEKIGATFQLVQRYESGELNIKNMSLDRAVKYADALGISVEALLHGDDVVTLYDLTGHEAGILVWDNGSVIVANWANCDANRIPILSPLGTLFDWPYQSVTVNGQHDVDDVRKALPGTVELVEDGGEKIIEAKGMEILYDYFGDIPALFGFDTGKGAALFDEPTSGTVYDITADGDHIAVIAPADWN